MLKDQPRAMFRKNLQPIELSSTDVIYFAHIPKTGGTTLQYILAQHLGYDEVCPTRFQRIPPDKLKTYRMFSGHLLYLNRKRIPEPTIRLTILRDPISRTISFFEHLRRVPSAITDGTFLRDPGKVGYLKFPYDPGVFHSELLEQGIDRLLDDPVFGAVLTNYQTRYLVADAKQGLVGNVKEENLLAIAKAYLGGLTYFGLLEHYQESIDLLCFLFKWPPPHHQPRLNAGGGDKKYVLPVESRKKLEAMLDLDLELYRFAEDLFFRRHAAMIRTLLLRPYQATLRRRPASECIDLDFRNAIDGSGWHEAEVDRNGNGYRWSGPEPHSTVDLRLQGGQSYKLRIEICDFVARRILQSLQVSVNGANLPLTQIEGRTIYEALLPKHLINGERISQVVFSMADTLYPNSLGRGGDRRKIGIAVHRLQLSPVLESGESA